MPPIGRHEKKSNAGGYNEEMLFGVGHAVFNGLVVERLHHVSKSIDDFSHYIEGWRIADVQSERCDERPI